MTKSDINKHSVEYQLKPFSPVQRKPVPIPQVTPSKSPEETVDENSSFVRGHIVTNRAYIPRWMSNDSWTIEVASQVFSILCMVAIIALLAKIEGSLLESWPSPVSPNAVVSIASTAAKAALILPVAEAISQLKWLHFRTEGRTLGDLQTYDDASRGPMGAFTFFWRCRRSSLVAYIGCAITIVALTVDPFSQQILSYHTMPTLSPGSVATTSRSLIYDYGSQGQGDNGVSGDGVYARDNGMAAAVMTGVYGFQTPVQFQCTSSNCTFPDFTSLGVCSECTDVTASTIQTCNSTGFEHVCFYQLPSGAILSGAAQNDAHNGFTHSQVNTTVTTTNDYAFNTLNLTKHGAPIIYLGLVRFPYSGGLDFDNWQSGHQLYQCDLYFCAQKFHGTTVQNSTVTTQSILQREMNDTVSPGELIGMTALQPWSGDSNFTINFYDTQNIAGFLQSVLDFSNPLFVDGMISTSIQGALTGSTNIPDTISGIATGLTNHIRAGPNATDVVGEVWVPKTYIHVGWVWLTVPILLVIAASVLLGTVIMLTHRARQAVWKSSLLPLVLLPLGSEREGELGREFVGEEYSGDNSWTRSKMENRARELKSRLLVQDGNRPVWKFN
ncbi:hypothetical protein EG329_005148 [Mollisiaceae sp. DMI_Dod_QoI]|nr:hypothetical protein EG329_005148 [Helotiales sp. DMI_Dod_QoI]